MALTLSLSRTRLTEYVAAQVNHFFPDDCRADAATLRPAVATALDRIEHCFSAARPRRYRQGNTEIFNHLYSDQYLVFLWVLSNETHAQGYPESISDKIYYLNKLLHAFDCIYTNRLPPHFLVIHGVGTVLGNAEYGDYFVAYHGCTVGQNGGDYPQFGAGVGLGTGATVVGPARIGTEVSIGAGVTLVGGSVDDGSAVWRNAEGRLITGTHRNRPIARDYFDF